MTQQTHITSTSNATIKYLLIQRLMYAPRIEMEVKRQQFKKADLIEFKSLIEELLAKCDSET